MKVLYIGCYREGTGWGNAAIGYILAMDSVGIDVVCRPLKLNNSDPPLPDKIIELESKDIANCDVCIQHVLPHHMEYNSTFEQNIALYVTETSSFQYSIWPKRINQLDRAWVACEHSLQASLYSGVEIPISVIPHAADVSKFEQSYPKLDIPKIDNTFSFYFIGEATRRKNLVALIKAFHLEFTPNEPVSLVIKTSKPGMSPEECHRHIGEMCNKVKSNLKLYKNIEDYKEEVILTNRLSDEEILGLHQTCNCFVMPSFGEAWCIPAFDAMGFGNTPICTNIGGMTDFLGDGGGVLVEGNSEPVFGMTETFHDIYTGREDWCNIDIRYLQAEMRYIYTTANDNNSDYLSIREKGRLNVYNYSYEKVGALMKKELENAS